MRGYDYEQGFKSREDCEGVCNNFYNGKHGCLAFEWHQTDLHCVPYNGSSLTPEQFHKSLYDLKTYSVCMLVPDNDATEMLRPAQAVQQQVGPSAPREAQPVEPRHCGGPERKCTAKEFVSSKQRNQIPLMARLTMSPEPDIDGINWMEANQWLAARWHEWIAQGSPMR
jgi:hypothetical protein